MKIHRIFTLFFAVCLTISTFNYSAYAKTEKSTVVNDVDIVILNNDSEISIKNNENKNGDVSFKAKKITFSQVGTGLKIELDMQKKNSTDKVKDLDFVVDLYPSQSELFNNSAVIGVVSENNSDFEIKSFRIESNSKSYTLLERNLDLEGKTVVTFALQEKDTGKLYYIQDELPDILFSELLEIATSNLDSERFSQEELINIELDYFTLKQEENTQIVNINSEIDINDFDEINELESETPNLGELIDLLRDEKSIKISDKKNNQLYEGDVKTNSLIYNVEDSIFSDTSISFDDWQHDSDWSDPAYCYSFITYNFAGTSNRLTYIVYMQMKLDINKRKQSFSYQLEVRDNVSVLYNIYDGELAFFGDNNRIDVEDIELYFKSNTTGGVFTKRYFGYLRQGSFFNNIVRAVIVWAPYGLDKVGYSYDYLKNSSDLEKGEWYFYGANAAAQAADNPEKRVIDEVEVEFSKICKEGDYVQLWVYGDSVNSIDYGFDYNVDYN